MGFLGGRTWSVERPTLDLLRLLGLLVLLLLLLLLLRLLLFLAVFGGRGKFIELICWNKFIILRLGEIERAQEDIFLVLLAKLLLIQRAGEWLRLRLGWVGSSEKLLLSSGGLKLGGLSELLGELVREEGKVLDVVEGGNLLHE